MESPQFKYIAPLAENPPHVERLSIAPLMLWTATTAMVLGMDRATSEPSNGELGKFPLIIAWGYAPLVGAGLAGWMLMFSRIWSEGPKFPSQPGHWLLLLAGIGGVVQLFVRAMISLAAAGLASLPALLLIRLVGLVAAIFVYSLALRESQGIWRTVFWLGMLSNIFSLLLNCAGLFRSELILAWLLTGIILIGVGGDIRAGTRRDYLHWLGIFVRIAYLALMTAIPFLIRALTKTP